MWACHNGNLQLGGGRLLCRTYPFQQVHLPNQQIYYGLHVNIQVNTPFETIKIYKKAAELMHFVQWGKIGGIFSSKKKKFPYGYLLIKQLQQPKVISSLMITHEFQFIMMFQNIDFACIVTIAFLLTLTTAVSSLTQTNCPQGYDFAAVNGTADSSEQAFVTLLYGGLYSAEDQATLSNSYSQGDTKTVGKYMASMKIIIPFAIIGGGFFIIFFAALCCCVCEKQCPPCQSWRRDYAARPYQKFQMKCVTIFSMIFALAITITAVVGFAFFPALQKDIKMTKCALYYSIDVAVNGDLDKGWGGFTQLASQIGNISSQLSTASTAASANISNSDWLMSDFTALKQANINLYTNNNLSTVYSPNPSTASNSPLPTVVPLFISSGLGPYTQNATMTYDIHQALQNTTGVLAAQGYKVFKAAQTLTNSANSIQTNTNINMQSITMNSDYFDVTTASVNTFSKDIFEAMESWALYLVQAILIFIMIAGLIIMMGVVATHFFEVYTCKTCVHLGWVTFGITYFGIVVIAFFFFGMGGLSYSFCQFYNGILTSQASFNSFTQSSKPTSFNRVFSKMATCFYGSGSITSSFNLNNEIKTVSLLYAEINSYLDMRDTANSAYVNLSVTPAKISGWVNTIGMYQKGIYVDVSVSVTTQENPLIALDGMNKYTNNGTGGIIPTCTFDYWVYDKTNCTGWANQTNYTATLTSGTEFVSTGFLCISLNDQFRSNSTSIWTQSDFANRYIMQRQCQSNTQAYDAIMSYADSILNYRDSRINLYQNIKDQLTSVLNQNTAYNTKLNAFTSSIRSFVTATNALNTLVTNTVNGLDHASNCTAVANSLRLFYNIFCVSFIYKSVQFGICCLVLLAVMIGGMLTGSVFGTRYGRLEKDRKIVMPEVPLKSDMHSETFERRQKSSEDSSSDQD